MQGLRFLFLVNDLGGLCVLRGYFLSVLCDNLHFSPFVTMPKAARNVNLLNKVVVLVKDDGKSF